VVCADQRGWKTICLTLFLAGAATSLWAHAILMESTPKLNSTVKGPDFGVTLRYNVRIDGTDTVIGGTSAVAPLWAGLIARINQSNGTPVGYLNPMLYSKPQGLRDIISGSNGDFEAAQGWDACTGLGSPNGPVLHSAV